MKIKLLTLSFFLFAVTALNAANRTVNLASFTGATNYATVTDALAAAASGDVVYVAAGTYAEAELTIPAGVTVIGGLPSSATTAADRVYPGSTFTASQWTILDGGAAHRVSTVAGTIDGCIIRNGKHDTQGGGALITTSGTVKNCIIRGNQCHNTSNTGKGGGVFMQGNSTLINCVVDFNMASTGFAISGDGNVINSTITNNCNAPVWILIPAGSFSAGLLGTNGSDVVGTNDDNCTLTAYYMSQTETTCAQYAVFANAKGFTATPTMAFAGQTGSPNYLANGTYTLFSAEATAFLAYTASNLWVPAATAGNMSMTNVSWYGSLAYCQWLGGKLPTEAQWEYAARRTASGYSNNTYAGSNALDGVAWYSTNSGSSKHTVATKTGTALVLFDMSGNVWEWCSDWYSVTYPNPSLSTDPVGPSTGAYRLLRGGSWGYSASTYAVSYRYNTSPTCLNSGYGFRPIVQ